MTSPNTYTPEMRAADAEIAKAMGWTEVHAYHETYYGTVPPLWKNQISLWNSRVNPVLHREVPRFHESHDARAALLEWLAADEKRWHRFDDAFYRLNPVEDENDYCRAAFLATPAQIAGAALRVIKEME